MLSKTFLLFISTSAFSAVFLSPKKINFDFFLLHWRENIGIMCICIERVTKKSTNHWLQLAHMCGAVRMHTEYDTMCVCSSIRFHTSSYYYFGMITVVCLIVRFSVCVYVFHTGLHQVRSKTEGFFPSLSNELYGWTAYKNVLYVCEYLPLYVCACVCVYLVVLISNGCVADWLAGWLADICCTSVCMFACVWVCVYWWNPCAIDTEAFSMGQHFECVPFHVKREAAFAYNVAVVCMHGK